MKVRSAVYPLFIAVLLTAFGACLALAAKPVLNGNASMLTNGTNAKKFSFTVQDVNRARLVHKKPQFVLSWETRVKMANDALARDSAKIKTSVDGVLIRAAQKAAQCSTENYTLQDLESLCQPNEGVQACLDRLQANCIVGASGQQVQNSLADAFAAMTIRSDLSRLRKDIDNLEKALYQE